MPDESLITDAMRAALQRQHPPVTGVVTAQEIKRYAYATDDLNPIYLSDEEARRAGLPGTVAPPLFLSVPTRTDAPLGELAEDGIAKASSSLAMSDRIKRVVAGGTEYEFHEHIRPGDTLTATRRIADMYEKQGRSGPMAFVVSETTYRNQHGKVVGVQRFTAIYRP
jgi:3-methylfumaryl-CoA hydratase